MTQEGLRDTLTQITASSPGEAAAILFEALSITGFAMQYLRSSRPVSGCEHLWSHVWEMEDLSVDSIPVTHGHKVALGTLAAAAFTEALFSQREPPYSRWKHPSPAERKAEVLTAFSSPLIRGTKPAEAAVKTALEKLLPPGETQTLTEALRDNWKDIREAVLEKLPPYGELKALLLRGNCPVVPGEIGLTRDRVISDALRAQMIRNRYTVLDLAWDLGVLGDLQKKVAADTGYLL
jgi:glycerol-1-phosphate dehydrogenase [NAD(P)+]